MIEIRQADAVQAELIAGIVEAAFAPYRGRLDPEPSALTENAASIAARLRDEHAIVAWLGDTAAGSVLYKYSPAGLHISRLAVLPACRRKGVARALLGFVEAEARRLRAPRLTLGTRIALPGNIRLFKAVGFVEIGREAHPGYAVPTIIHMEKPVPGDPP